jgi:hypothetical protein
LLIDGVKAFVVLEPPKVPNPPPDGNGFVCIDAGIFPLSIRWSDKFQRPMPHVENVPNRTGVELHMGNFPSQSEACGLIGLDFGDMPDYVSHSDASFSSLMAILYRGAALTNPNAPEPEQIWHVGTIQYIDPQGVTSL